MKIIDTRASFTILPECYKGICTCIHKIGGVMVQLKPCRFFCELFLCGPVDLDCIHILKGVTFGFQVINDNLSLSHTAVSNNINNKDLKQIIENKLVAEIQQGVISVVESPMKCSHAIFCIPKENTQVALYATWLARSLKYVSIINYLSVLNFFLKENRYPPIDYSAFILN